MIYVLYGDNSQASYERLTSLLKDLKDYLKIDLSADKHNSLDLNVALNSQDLLNAKKLIICTNFLARGKIKEPNKLNLAPNTILILIESSNLPPSIISKISSIAKIEQFRLPSYLYNFLDSLAPGSLIPIKTMSKLENDTQLRLIWHLTNRIVLLILAKLALSLDETSKVTRANIAQWQWAKLTAQSRNFKLKTLKSILTSLLKVDYMLKTNATSLTQYTLLKMLLLKYLKNT